MPILRIPAPLRAYTAGQAEVAVCGETAGQAMESLVSQYPGLRPHLYNSRGELRPFVNLYLGQENIKTLQGLETPLCPDDHLRLIPAIAGG
jgi:molybdopterin converting factor small subunit